ncbi:MAG: response regulator transcription factor [Deltaproteobacteria bacterium]|nr:MAG: response regulator transcription factor [Deltaproteobacteria bacterium]
MAGKSILIVEDEQDLVDLLSFNLRQAGYQTASAMTGEEALQKLRDRPDLILLDLMLPDVQGTEICRAVKSATETRHIPVIMVTARGEELDRVVGFELGADDFVTKPFSMRELILRVRAVLRRGPPGEQEVIREKVGPIRVDLSAHRAYVDGEEVQLTALEFRLLTTFLSRIGRLQTRAALLRDVWGMSSEMQTRTVDTHVKRLREKLGKARELIETVRGAGYRMVDPEES